MQGKRIWLIVGLSAFLVVALLTGVILLQQIPDVSQQLPLNSVPLTVTIGSPLNGSTVPLDGFTTITAEAAGAQPISSLQLWVDGAPTEAKSAPPSSPNKQFSAFWTWTPATQGAHLIFVRGTDATQQIATSNVVRVIATKDANIAEKVNYKIEQGDTVETVAKKFNTSPQSIVDLNPAGTIGTGQTISVPIAPPPLPQPPLEGGAPPEPPGGPVEPAPSGPPNKAIFWINKNLLGNLFKPSLPAAPALAQKSEGCSIKLFIADNATNEHGFFIYRADTANQSFKRIATLDAFSGTGPFVYVDSNVYGPLAYYVASFNTAGESPSKYVQSEIYDSKCASPNWTDISLHTGKLLVKQSVDKVYCYLSVNNGPWSRIPSAPNAFLYPTNGEFDVSQEINTLVPAASKTPLTLALECWGWSGNALVYLGEAKQTLNPSPQPIAVNMASKFDFLGNVGSTHVMSGGVGPPPTGLIAPPLHLRPTTNPTECNAHALDPNSVVGQIASAVDWCSEKIKGYDLVLIWEWSPDIAFPCTPNGCPETIKTIEGYNLYGFGVQTDGTQVSRKLLGTLTPSTKKVFTTKWFPGVCYAVRAFAGIVESSDSNIFCPTGQEIGTETVKLYLMPSPHGKTTKTRFMQDDCTGHYGLNEAYGLGPDGIAVGFTWSRDRYECDELQRIYQGAIRFDLTPIMNRGIVHATLSYWMSQTKFWAGSEAQNGWSCAQTLELGKTGWKEQDIVTDQLLPADPYITLSTKKGGYAARVQDVTEAVRSWANSSRPNGGFIFNGVTPFGPPGDGYESACWSVYNNFELNVSYGK